MSPKRFAEGNVTVPSRTLGTRGGEGGQPLPRGHRLHEFTIEVLLHASEHSLLYTALDNALQRKVALKEYMPSPWVQRLPDQSITLRSRRHEEAFARGRRHFASEAQELASFDHPSLQKVLRVWEGNGSVYAVMPYYSGQTLHDWLQAQDGPPDERWLKELLRPLLDALDVLHAGAHLHLDIAPSNILMLSGRRPVLMGFGARPVDEGAPALLLRPGYAAIEQYAESGSVRQGPWTDLYALCAVLHTAILGHAPLPSIARQIRDDQEPLAVAAAGRYSDAFLRSIDMGLAVQPVDRPPDVAALRARFFPEMFVLTEPAELDSPVALAVSSSHAPAPAPVRAPAAPRIKLPARPAPTAPAALRPVAHPSRASRLPWRSGLAVLACALGATAWWLGWRPADWPLEPIRVLFNRRSGITPHREPFSVVGALHQIVQQADPTRVVLARPDKSPLVVGRDRLQFHIQSNQTGYLYLFMTGADATHLWLLFPNQADNDNRIESDRDLVVPRGDWHIIASGPLGTDHLVALVTLHPMDLNLLGLRRDGDLHEFDLAMATRRQAAQKGPGSVLMGPPVCTGGPMPCQQRFGAALMRVAEVAPTGTPP